MAVVVVVLSNRIDFAFPSQILLVDCTFLFQRAAWKAKLRVEVEKEVASDWEKIEIDREVKCWSLLPNFEDTKKRPEDRDY